jgi:hypothetical protein
MLDPDSSLQVRAPRIGDIRVIRDRVLLAQRRARYLSMPLSESGVYIPHRSLPFYVQDGPLLYASAATGRGGTLRQLSSARIAENQAAARQRLVHRSRTVCRDQGEMAGDGSETLSYAALLSATKMLPATRRLMLCCWLATFRVSGPSKGSICSTVTSVSRPMPRPVR